MSTAVRHLVALAATLAVGAVCVAPAQAQSYEPLAYPAFSKDTLAWNGKRVRMHARFVSPRPEVQTKEWDQKYFDGSGITTKKFYRFTVCFDGQNSESLFPVIACGSAGDRLWAAVKALAPDAKCTFWGRCKRMGDGQAGGFRGSTYAPTLLEIARFEPGFVKDLDEYLRDLEVPEQREETVRMLIQGGEATLGDLQKAAESKRHGDSVRCAVLEAIGRIGKAGHAPRLSAQLRAEPAPRVRAEVLVTLARLDHDLALKELTRLLADPGSEAWASEASIELCLNQVTATQELAAVFGRKWDAQKPKLLASAIAAGDAAAKVQRLQRADACYTVALEIDPTGGPVHLARGRIREARAKEDPTLAAPAAADLQRALELGVEDPDVMLAHATRCAADGRADEARRWVEKVLAKRPEDRDARTLHATLTGGSLLMVDTRVSRMNGVSVRVPATWKDMPGDCDTATGMLLSLMGVGPRGVETDGRTWVCVLVMGKPPGMATPPGMPTALPPDPEGTVRDWLTRRRHQVVETGRATLASGHPVAWAVTTHEMAGLTVKRLIGFVFTPESLYECNYRCTEAEFDELRPTFVESMRSFAAGLDGK